MRGETPEEVYGAAARHLRKLSVKLENKTLNPVEIDGGTQRWHARNPWFGKNQNRTAYALGVHCGLEKEFGAKFVGTKEYWREIDRRMRQKFPAMKKRKK